MIVSRLGLVPKQMMVMAVRNSGHDHHLQWKGKNLFFNPSNHRTLAIKFAVFFGVPFWLPFLLLRFHLNKA